MFDGLRGKVSTRCYRDRSKGKINVVIDPRGDIVLTITTCWLIGVIFLYAVIPAIFLWDNRPSRIRRLYFTSTTDKSLSNKRIIQRLTLLTAVNIVLATVLVLFLNIDEAVIDLFKEIAKQFGYAGQFPKDIYSFPFDIAIFAVNGFLPLSTILMMMLWYSLRR